MLMTPVVWEWLRQEDFWCEASLYYIVRPCLKKILMKI